MHLVGLEERLKPRVLPRHFLTAAKSFDIKGNHDILRIQHTVEIGVDDLNFVLKLLKAFKIGGGHLVFSD